MKKLIFGFVLLFMGALCSITVQAQTTGAISGIVTDEAGALVPGATVTVTGEAGQTFTATTGGPGTYNIPAVAAGRYIVTVQAQGFKTAVIQNVRVNVGTPATVNARLEVGEVTSEVVVTTGSEVLQTQTPAIGTTIQGRQITETPISSRDALDLVLLLPGTATVGRPRASSINGLPKGAINISIDGVDVQDNTLRSSDGFFTYVRPRIDAIEEVTVTTAASGSESGGDGAVQIKFVTRRGQNDYTGGLYWQHRNTSLNSNYWYNNRDGLARQDIKLNQYGGRFGGPIPFLGIGEGVPAFSSGKDKRFFFINYEEWRFPQSVTRTRGGVPTPQLSQGVYRYIAALPAGGPPANCAATSATQMTCSTNVLQVASNNGQLATIDPTISSLLAKMQSAINSAGTLSPVTNNPNIQSYSFTNAASSLRKYLALRFDFNLTKDHTFEFVHNRQNFVPGMDFLNSRDPVFPGFPFYGQGGVRKSWSYGLRSSFGSRVTNELRWAQSGGATDFFGLNTQSAADFDYSRGLFLSIAAPMGLSHNPYSNGAGFAQTRSTPTYDLTNSTTWIAGNHMVNFGGQFKTIRALATNQNRYVPTISFGFITGAEPAFTMFNATTMPNSTAAQQSAARNLYAALVGRINGYASNAYLNASGEYEEFGRLTQNLRQRTYGLFIQDQWKIRPNFSLNFGIRWQPQLAWEMRTANFGKLEHPDQIWGISGPGNIFKPGATGGQDPRVVLYQVGEKAYSDDFDNYAPSVGFVWSPEYSSGFRRGLFGGTGSSVFRGGFSRSFIREGSALQTTITGNTPGGFLNLTRSSAIAGSLTPDTHLRDPNNPNLTTPAFSATPTFPTALTTASQALVVDPNIKTGHVDSYSFGYQRQLNRDTVVEVRYVGNRGYGVHRLNFVNETNTIENGFAAEWRLAQQNLYANRAANRCIGGGSGTTANPCQNNFAYHGPGTGTSPLPLMMAFTNTAATYNPTSPAAYAAATFANLSLATTFSQNAPNMFGFIGSSLFENSAAARARAIANGLPVNFFRVNPAVPAGAFQLSSDAKTWYDSGVVELRRRLSNGLRIQASYVFSKAQANAFSSSGSQQSNYTLRPEGLALAKNVQAFDITHAFKMDATYDLPIGRGRWLFRDVGPVTNAFVGGWSLMPVIRWQSGSPISFGNVSLVGMTKQELQKEIRVRKGASVVTFLPDDIIANTQAAFNIDLNGPGGYSTQFGIPTGRYIAPAGFGNCVSRFGGECGFTNLIMYGPDFFMFDMSFAKKFKMGERRNIELKATFLDLLNKPPFRVGGFAGDIIGVGVGGTTFGQLPAGSAYQDLSTTDNPGGRMIDLMIRFNF